MADFRNRKYSEFSPELGMWLPVEGDSSYISNLTLRRYNQAQDWLWQRRAWEYLVTESDLTISSRQATLPSDFGGIICKVFEDPNSDDKPDRYYYNQASVDRGFKVADSFTKAGGHVYTMTFYKTPGNTVTLAYPRILSDFVDSGTEYTYFPADLLTATAMMIHINTAKLVRAEDVAILSHQKELLRDYEQSHQYQNIEWRWPMLDVDGEQVDIDAYDLQGGQDSRWGQDYDYSYDGLG